MLNIPVELINSVNNRQLVLFVGHDLGAKELQIPSMSHLVSELAEQTNAWQECRVCCEHDRCKLPNDCNYSFQEIATIYEQVFDRRRLIKFLQNKLLDNTSSALDFQTITRLPVSTIITTVYDERLEAAYLSAGISCQSVADDSQVAVRESEEVQIIHLYGSLAKPKTLVLTEADHARLLEDKPLIAFSLQYYLTYKDCLFINLDFNNPYLQMLYSKTIKELGDLRRLPYVLNGSAKRNIVKAQNLPVDASKFLIALNNELAKHPMGELPSRSLPKPPKPQTPYKFLDYFEAKDRAIFIGREKEIEALTIRILSHRATVLYGYSGMGKTSLLQAGVIPVLESEGFNVTSLRLGNNALGSLQASLREMTNFPMTRNILILDQVEEVFTVIKDAETRMEAIDTLLSALSNELLDIHILLSLRIEYLGQLESLFDQQGKDNILSNRFRLGSLGRAQAEQAIEIPANQFSVKYEPDLMLELLDYLEKVDFEPSYLQIICYQLYQDFKESEQENTDTLTLSRYRQLGGVDQLLGGFLDQALNTMENETIQSNAQIILKNMVTIDRTKIPLTEEDIRNRTSYVYFASDELHQILTLLQKQRIIRGLEDGRYELVHDVLVPKIWEWMDDGDIARLTATQTLQQAMVNYRIYSTLMSEDKQLAVEQAAGALTFNADELVFLLMSAIFSDSRERAQKWVDKIDEFPDEQVKVTITLNREYFIGFSELQRELISRFDLTELHYDICIALGVDFDALEGKSITSKAQNLISYFTQRRRVEDLVTLCMQERPMTHWKIHIDRNSEDIQIDRSKSIIEAVRDALLSADQVDDFDSHKLKIKDVALRAEILICYDLFTQVLEHILNNYFSLANLEDICLQMDIDIDQLASQTRNQMSRELITRFIANGELDILVAMIVKERPDFEEFSDFQISAPPINNSYILFNLILESFNLQELEDLGNYLDFRLVMQGSKRDKARRLVILMRQQSRLDYLNLAVAKFRPNVINIENEMIKVLSARFDVEQVKTLCFDLDVNYEDLSLIDKNTFVKSLVKFMGKRKRLMQLIDAVIFPEYAGADKLEVKIRKKVANLREDELYNLCFILGIDWEDLPSTKSIDSFSRELISYILRYDLFGELAFALMRDYPAILSEDEVWSIVQERVDHNQLKTLLAETFKHTQAKGTNWREDWQTRAKNTPLDIGLNLILQNIYADEELFRNMCFDIGVNYEDLEANSFQGKQRELIAYLNRQNRLEDIGTYITKHHPELSDLIGGIFNETK